MVLFAFRLYDCGRFLGRGPWGLLKSDLWRTRGILGSWEGDGVF